MNNLTLLIPAKQESESLPIVLKEIDKYKCQKIIILKKNDIRTIKSIKKYKQFILYQKGNGYGNALIEGINKTKTKFFCIFNADGSFESTELKNMYKRIRKKQIDFVFGSRYENKSSSDDDTIVTRTGNFIFTKLGNWLFKLPLTDILYTYVLGRTHKVKSLKLNCNNFAFCVELPIKAARAKMKLTTVPSHEKKRIAGKKKVNAFKDGYQIMKYMLLTFFKK